MLFLVDLVVILCYSFRCPLSVLVHSVKKSTFADMFELRNDNSSSSSSGEDDESGEENENKALKEGVEGKELNPMLFDTKDWEM